MSLKNVIRKYFRKVSVKNIIKKHLQKISIKRFYHCALQEYHCALQEGARDFLDNHNSITTCALSKGDTFNNSITVVNKTFNNSIIVVTKNDDIIDSITVNQEIPDFVSQNQLVLIKAAPKTTREYNQSIHSV